MAWSKQTLTQFAPILAGGEIRKVKQDTQAPLPEPLRKAAASASKALRSGAGEVSRTLTPLAGCT
jgi:hypothetical protein